MPLFEQILQQIHKLWLVVSGKGNESTDNNNEVVDIRASRDCSIAGASVGDMNRSGAVMSLPDRGRFGRVAENTELRLESNPGRNPSRVPLLTANDDHAHHSLPVSFQQSRCPRPSCPTALQRRVSFSNKLEYHEFSNDDGFSEDGTPRATGFTIAQPQHDDKSYHLTPSDHFSLPCTVSDRLSSKCQ